MAEKFPKRIVARRAHTLHEGDRHPRCFEPADPQPRSGRPNNRHAMPDSVFKNFAIEKCCGACVIVRGRGYGRLPWANCTSAIWLNRLDLEAGLQKAEFVPKAVVSGLRLVDQGDGQNLKTL
ncbi:hypothetical protein D3C87_1267520 [compost metagenome]